MMERFLSRIIFRTRCLSCVSPLPFAGTVLPALMVLVSSTGFTRLNFFLTYGTRQLSFLFQNQATITGNFRPISLTSILCKLLERMVTERLAWILEGIQSLSPLQFGFRQSPSSLRAWYLGCILEREVCSWHFLWFAENMWYHLETWGLA